MAKLEANIQRTGQYPALIIRPNISKKGEYHIIDGHHRLRVLNKLGYTQVECQIWEISEADVEIALMTLNRLRGEDNPIKRAALLESLAQNISLDELTQYLPETRSQLEDLMALRNLDLDILEAVVKQEIQEQAMTLPVPFAFMVPAEDVSLVESALGRFLEKLPKKDQTLAFVSLCRHVMQEAEDG